MNTLECQTSDPASCSLHPNFKVQAVAAFTNTILNETEGDSLELCPDRMLTLRAEPEGPLFFSWMPEGEKEVSV
jgi:hypothetical protein